MKPRFLPFQIFLVCGSLLLLSATHAHAQATNFWTGASNGFWSVTSNWIGGIPGGTGTGGSIRVLNFGTNGNAAPNSTNDISGLSGFRIFFNSGATNFTLFLKSGTSGTTLNDFGGVQPQLQNDSTNLQTVDMSFNVQAKGITGAANQFANINASSGDLLFTTNCTLTVMTNTQLHFFSTAGRTVTFQGPVLSQNLVTTNTCAILTTGSGGAGPTIVFANTNALATNVISTGTMRLAASNVTTAPFFIGETNAANAASANLVMDNGFSNSSAIIIQTLQPGVTNTRVIGNTSIGSGAATFAGPVSLGTNLTTVANPAGALIFNGDFNFQNPSGGTSNRTLTVNGAGNTTIAGNLTNASTGISVVVKTNTGTLSLLGTNNSSRIMYNLGGGVLSITNAAAIGIPTNVSYPDKFNFTSNATLRVTNSFTLGSAVASTNNAGFRIAEGFTGTFDVSAGSTFTVDGAVVEFGASGVGSLAKLGTGTLVLQQSNSYSGPTTISAGALKAANTTGSATGTGAVEVSATGTLTGGGSVAGAVTVDGTISPGNTLGTISTGAETWDNGGHYTWNLDSVSGSAGVDPGWNLINVNGALNIAAAGGGFSIDINGLDLGDVAGAVNGFANTSSYTWTILHTTGGITGFSPSAFTLNLTNFTNNNAQANGVFNLVLANSGNDLALTFNTPPVAGTANYGRPKDVGLHINVSDLLTNATDVNGDAISLVSAGPTSTNGATITVASGIVSYTPPATNPNVTDSFTYTVQDTFGATATGTVIISILPPDNNVSVNITSMTTLPDGTVQLGFAGIPGQSYLIQATTNLTPVITWTTLSTNTASTNGLFQYIDLAATNFPTRFYRTATP